MACQICGKSDLFTDVTGEPSCSICTIKFVGGLPQTRERIKEIRVRLGLNDGEYLKQDNAAEAARILGR